MSDDVKRITGGPVAPVDQDAIEARDRDAPATNEAAADTYVQAARLRGVIDNPKASMQAHFLAIDDYRLLLPNFKDDSAELYAGAAALRRSMQDPEGFQGRIAMETYQELAKKFSKDSPLVYREAKALGDLLLDENLSEVMVAHALKSYASLVPKFADGSPEVYRGANIIIEILVRPGSRDIRSGRVVDSAAQIFGSLARKFRADGPIAAAADRTIVWYMSEPIIKKYFGEVLKQTFHNLSSIGFFKAGFESGRWIAGLGLLGFSEKAMRNLRGFANQPGFIGFRDSVMTVLDTLDDWTFEKMDVMNRVFEATDPSKWKSVRNTLRTLRALAALDSLPKEVGREFYRSHGDLEGDTRALIRADVEKALLNVLREKIGDKGALGLLFMDEAPNEKNAQREWRHAQEVRRSLSDKGLLVLFAQSASFMDGEGVRILRDLISDLVMSPVLEGSLHHLKRYDRMRDQLGFSPSFVESWRREWRNVRESAGEAGEATALVMKQAAEQLAVHVNSTPGVDGEFKELPDGLRALTEKLSRGDADVEEAKRLHGIMELNYAKIREAYGDLFANARVDLKNLVTGLTRGVKTAKRTALTEITGLAEKLAFHGMIPTETCQRLSSLYAESTNGKGQPLNKLLWGQFKLANFVMDGEVMARRMLEVTRDEEGAEHLLVERAYTAGGFARLAEFDEDIVEHAQSIGIDRDRVHFLDRHEKREVPGPLATGALIYRDSGLAEVNPAFMSPYRPLPMPVAAMPMISAGMMLRTGT